jgi:PqqD family protein of HPr-rel-A system
VPALKPKTRADLTVVELDGEAIVYDDESRKIHHLNPTATIVFNLCDGSATISELSGEIAEAFKLQPDEVERQVRGLLRQFRKEQFLEGRALEGAKARSNGVKPSQTRTRPKSAKAGTNSRKERVKR